MKLQVKEQKLRQGADEEIAYALTTTPWGKNPTDVAVKAYDCNADYADVTSRVLSGAASVTGDVITTPVVKSLKERTDYRIEVKFTTGSKVLECFFMLHGER